MAIEIITRRASFGLELRDALTGGSLVGPSGVEVVDQPATPILGAGSRWFFEQPLASTTTFVITARDYVTETRTVAVPPPPGPGGFLEISMLPRTGYQFPAWLTRVVGGVVLDLDGSPAAGAIVRVTPTHSESSTSGAELTTRTTDEGQYTMWFDAALPPNAPPLPDRFAASAEAVIDGVAFSGTTTEAPLRPNAVTPAETIRLVETP